MWKLALVLTFGLGLVPMFVASRGRRHTTVFYWGLAGLILFFTGMALAVGEQHAPALALAQVAGPVSASLFFLGARRFAHREALRWVPRVGSAGALFTGLMFFAVSREAAVAVQLAVSLPMLAASAWVVIENAWRRRASLAEKALGLTIVVLALVTPIDSLTRMLVDADRILLPLWATLSFAIGFLTLASLAERAGRRARELTGELEERTNALDLERRTLRALIESSPMGIALADPSGRIRFLNDRAANLLGIASPEAWYGRPATEIAKAMEERLTLESRAMLATLIDGDFSLAGAGAAPRIDLELDGGATLLELLSAPVRGEDGRVLGRLWICREVTEERKLRDRLSEAQRMETVGTLAGGIAHDFNNQLVAILGNIEKLMLSLPEGDERWESARSVEQSVLHCAALTQGLLSFARRRSPNPQPVRVEAVVQDVAALLRPGLAAGTELTAIVAENTGSILADVDDFRRVLMNLGVNARDAIGGNGSIRIEARRLDAGDDGEVEIVVADDGIGMDEMTRRRIFDPFFTTKEPGKGTGLGLAVVYGIAEAHGASIELESELGRGTTCRLVWPAALLDSVEQAAPPTAEATAARPGSVVLLGEDDPAVRRTVRAMLERAGYRVIEATDGPGAVASFRDHEADVDLVLLDLGMPRFSGLEALRQIRAVAPDRPAILMSGNPDRFWEELPEDAELLRKPFGSRGLISCVREVLERQASRAR